MSPVPAFDPRGLMPPYIGSDATTPDRSPYDVRITEIVMELGTTPFRKRLLQGLLNYRRLLGTLGYTHGLQFIDGSFVENVEARESRSPGDIDIFSFLVRPTKYQTDPQLWQNTGYQEWATEIVDRGKNKSRFGLDTYAIAIDQQSPLNVINETVYWYSLFSHKRISHDWKGFLRVSLNAADDQSAEALL